jgi:hypothetical protein
MTNNSKLFGCAGVLSVALGWAYPAMAEYPANLNLTVDEQAAVFKAAGFKLMGKEWRACETGDSGAPYSPGVIEAVRDLNGDGRPEAVVTEGGSYCYGAAETGFQLLSKQTDGSWRVITGSSGVPEFLKTYGKAHWPDISIGGPGFCFPVERWNGKEYKLNRFEYAGKRCKPPR